MRIAALHACSSTFSNCSDSQVELFSPVVLPILSVIGDTLDGVAGLTSLVDMTTRSPLLFARMALVPIGQIIEHVYKKKEVDPEVSMMALEVAVTLAEGER